MGKGEEKGGKGGEGGWGKGGGKEGGKERGKQERGNGERGERGRRERGKKEKKEGKGWEKEGGKMSGKEEKGRKEERGKKGTKEDETRQKSPVLPLSIRLSHKDSPTFSSSFPKTTELIEESSVTAPSGSRRLGREGGREGKTLTVLLEAPPCQGEQVIIK